MSKEKIPSGSLEYEKTYRVTGYFSKIAPQNSILARPSECCTKQEWKKMSYDEKCDVLMEYVKDVLADYLCCDLTEED